MPTSATSRVEHNYNLKEKDIIKVNLIKTKQQQQKKATHVKQKIGNREARCLRTCHQP